MQSNEFEFIQTLTCENTTTVLVMSIYPLPPNVALCLFKKWYLIFAHIYGGLYDYLTYVDNV
jgi:hypothetical protein